MLGTRFYNESFRKVLVAFGTLFNNITIERDDGLGNADSKEILKVPLAYGPRSKFNAILESQGTQSATQITIPRMTFDWVGTTYDPIRKLTTVARQGVATSGSGNTTASYQWQRVPYNMSITLALFVETTEDGLKIIEQILPFFTPEFSLTIDDVVDYDLPIILESVSQEDAWTGDFTERRYIAWTLTFNAKMYLYGPQKTSKLITKSMAQIYSRETLPFDSTQIDNPSNPLNNATSRSVSTPTPAGATAENSTGSTTTVTEQ